MGLESVNITNFVFNLLLSCEIWYNGNKPLVCCWEAPVYRGEAPPELTRGGYFPYSLRLARRFFKASGPIAILAARLPFAAGGHPLAGQSYFPFQRLL